MVFVTLRCLPTLDVSPTTGETIGQTFTACATGTLKQVTYQIQHIDADFVGRISVRDSRNNVMLAQEVSARNVKDGLLIVPMNEKVREGADYTIYLSLTMELVLLYWQTTILLMLLEHVLSMEQSLRRTLASLL